MLQVPVKFSRAEYLLVFPPVVDTVIPKQTFVPVGCCVSNVKYFRSEVKALSLHLAQPSQAVVTHTKPLLTGIGAQTSGQAQLDAWSQRMFPALYFSMFANIVITFPLCVSFTGEEVPIRLSMFLPSRKSQRGSLCSSTGASPALHLQPRSSWRNQEQPPWAGNTSSYNQTPPSIMLQSREAKDRVYL